MGGGGGQIFLTIFLLTITQLTVCTEKQISH